MKMLTTAKHSGGRYFSVELNSNLRMKLVFSAVQMCVPSWVTLSDCDAYRKVELCHHWCPPIYNNDKASNSVVSCICTYLQTTEHRLAICQTIFHRCLFALADMLKLEKH